MGRPLLKPEDYARLAAKDLDLTLKHLSAFEVKFPEEFAKWIKQSFVSRSVKKIQAYQD